MFSECLEHNLAQVCFAFAWFIVSFVWNFLTFIIHKRHSVILHGIIGIFILIKVTPALIPIMCYLQSLYSWLYLPMYICEGIVIVAFSAAEIGIFFFISIGIGVLDMRQVQLQVKPMLLCIGLSYIVSASLYIFLTIGSALSVILYQIVYICYLYIVLYTVAQVRDTNNPVSAKQIKILHKVTTCVFVYCQCTSGYFCVLFIDYYFNLQMKYLDLWIKGLQFIILVKLLYVIRPRLNSGYTHDFIIEPLLARAGMLQATLSNSNNPIQPPGCLVVISEYPSTLFYGHIL